MFNFFQRNSVNSIDVNEIDNISEKINLIDIREPYEYKSGHLPKTKNIPMKKILSETERYLDKSREYYIICQTGARSSRVCRILKKKGFTITNVSGGTGRYRGSLKK